MAAPATTASRAGRCATRCSATSGRDRVSGGGGNDSLFGGSGNDRLTGGKGKNVIEGGTGNDRIFAKNGRTDRIDCGFGKDNVVSRDRSDKLTSCEKKASLRRRSQEVAAREHRTESIEGRPHGRPSCVPDTVAPMRRVLMGLQFFPRGGSAHVARNLARSLPEAGWDATLVSGSLDVPGRPGNARQFYGGSTCGRST